MHIQQNITMQHIPLPGGEASSNTSIKFEVVPIVNDTLLKVIKKSRPSSFVKVLIRYNLFKNFTHNFTHSLQCTRETSERLGIRSQ